MDKQLPIYLFPEQVEWLKELLHDFQGLDTTTYEDEAQASVIYKTIEEAEAKQA